MSATSLVETYIARQQNPGLRLRRHMLRTVIRQIPFRMCDLRIAGTDHIPDEGPVIMMMNHISALDPGLIMGAVTNRFVIPMTKIENTFHIAGALAVWWWDAYTVRRGEVDRSALVNSIELLKSGQCILIAPEGHRQKTGLARPKEGLAYVATKANAVIVPAAISGAIGWKEKWLKLQRPHIEIQFGRPFRFRTGGQKRVPREELASMTDEAMYQLAAAVTDESMRGIYSDLSKASERFLEFI
ncbi:MAG: 1-acyl-sn-glycerol-3-phosphate acyltransferase [Anaerolineae bacterium]|nr:1-acyl-sn-glycerol-3-phosphate acyltransferase [Anaerolineae bacterium]